jgi:hypothetical protein
MKKIFSILALVCLGFMTSYAQQGTVHVINNTNCDIGVDVANWCPECIVLSSQTMWTVNPHSTLDFDPNTYPWLLQGDFVLPACLDWQWYYADVYACNNYIRVGRNVPNATCPQYNRISETTDECGCTNGSFITVTFDVDVPVPGDVTITIF